jgi:hypothetical protein
MYYYLFLFLITAAAVTKISQTKSSEEMKWRLIYFKHRYIKPKMETYWMYYLWLKVHLFSHHHHHHHHLIDHQDIHHRMKKTRKPVRSFKERHSQQEQQQQ